MESEIRAFLQSVVSVVKDHAAYSPSKRAWIIPEPYLETILEDQFQSRPYVCNSFAYVLMEGARRGLWELDFDNDYLSGIVVVRGRNLDHFASYLNEESGTAASKGKGHVR
jgi:hypothetical protein